MELYYGPVFIMKGHHQGRIGYYDDDDSIFSDDAESDSHDFINATNWCNPDDTEYLEEGIKVLDAVIVYFGGFFLSDGYYLIPREYIRQVTTSDLMERREKLHDLCGTYAEIKNPSLKMDESDKISLLRELYYVDSTLVDRMVETRYSNNERGKKIFISYSTKDKTVANWLGTDLKAAGHTPWLDEWSINIGESIPQKISEGIKEADFIIVILSENSTTSNWVEKEWQTKYWNEVETGNIQVLPVLYQDCEIPELLKIKKYADFRNNYNDGLEDILLAIDRLSDDN